MVETRDTSKDGSKNKLEFVVLTRLAPVWWLIQRSRWLTKKVNHTLIDRLIDKIPTRPYPFSTKSPYTSWDSLIDRTNSGMHLPPLDWEPLTDEGRASIASASPGFGTDLPPAEEVAELFRGGPETKYSPKSALTFPHFVQWFTDGFLRTDRQNQLKTVSNHHIDLCTVYGLRPSMTEQLRSHQGGTLKSQILNGEEYPPFYYDEQLQPKAEFSALAHLSVEPSAAEGYTDAKKAMLFAMGVEVERANVQAGYVMLNVLCLREHNRLCQLLARTYPAWDDERLFQTARNIVIVEVMKIVIDEYINHISPYHFKFLTDPLSFTDEKWYRLNWMTVEFSLVYRWHSMMPAKIVHQGQPIPVSQSLWNSNMIVSQGLGAMFQETSAQPAGMLDLFNTPDFMVPVELASIRLGRAAKLRSYNDYREMLEYPRVTSFDQISSDDRICKELERVYGHVDNIELYVGLYAEDGRKNSALPSMVGRLVAIDAFSQALTNPLLSEHVFNRETFSPVGWDEIMSLHSLSELVHRNIPAGQQFRVSFYREDWKRS
ncbi:MAG: prostaglandin-endoperoxide synthase 2 [Actinomycetota bacterium]|nr:prostaglandin-endoperoxide synthase 2 [Actinomycetota bacterium]